MSNRPGRKAALLAAVAAVLGPTLALAQNRAGFVGESVVVPWVVEPGDETGDETVSIDFGVSFTERWFGMLSWGFGLNGRNRLDVVMGPRVYFRPFSSLKPFVDAAFAYSIDPANQLGWKARAGMEWNPARFTKQDNLRLELSVGAFGYHPTGKADLYAIEAIRAGLSWSY